MPGETTANVMEDLDNFIGSVKEARVKEAQARKEAAGISDDTGTPPDQDQGKRDSKHPSTEEDAQIQLVTEGARSSENEADVTAPVGEGGVGRLSINEANPDDAHNEPGPVAMTNAKMTGEGAGNTSSADDKKDDPGNHANVPTTHEATPNKDPEKYASWAEGFQKAASEHGFVKVATDLGNAILADIANAASQQGQAPVQQKQAAEADQGSELNGVMNELVKEAHYGGIEDAQILFDYYRGIEDQSEAIKQAMEGGSGDHEEEESGEDDSEEGSTEGNGSDSAPEEGTSGEAEGGDGALPVEDLEQLTGIAGGGEGGEMPMGPEGGMPVDPMMADMAGDEEIVMALSQALEDAGATPEELAMAIEAANGGMDAGAPIEAKMAAVKTARDACSKVNMYRNLASVGRWPMEKKASLELQYSLRHNLVRKFLGR